MLGRRGSSCSLASARLDAMASSQVRLPPSSNGRACSQAFGLRRRPGCHHSLTRQSPRIADSNKKPIPLMQKEFALWKWDLELTVAEPAFRRSSRALTSVADRHLILLPGRAQRARRSATYAVDPGKLEERYGPINHRDAFSLECSTSRSRHAV
jgi:hypothetical protein